MKLKRYFLVGILSVAVLFGHRVNIFAYVEGKKVFAECYYSDGSPVKSQKIEVFDSNGNKLLEGETSDEGIFSFLIPRKTDLKLVLSAGMGHQAEAVVSADDMPNLKPTSEPQKEKVQKEKKVVKPEKPEIPHQEEKSVSVDELQEMIGEVLDQRLTPIRRALIEEQNRISFTEVIGGIGYIFGIMGIILYFRSRKKK